MGKICHEDCSEPQSKSKIDFILHLNPEEKLNHPEHTENGQISNMSVISTSLTDGVNLVDPGLVKLIRFFVFMQHLVCFNKI